MTIVVVPANVSVRKSDNDRSKINWKQSSSPFLMRKFCLVLQFEQIKTQFGPTLTALSDPHLERRKLNS